MTFSPRHRIPQLTARTIIALTTFVASWAGVLPRARAAAISFVVSGGGWGHGVGMSQWGAKGQADAGRPFEQILTHYYQGTSVGAFSMPSEVRVGILWDRLDIQVTASGPFEIHYQSPSGELLAEEAADQIWRISTDGSGSLVLTGPGGQQIVRPGGTNALFVTYAHRGSLLRLPQTGIRYAYGHLEINSYAEGGPWRLRAIAAAMTMQQYLYGLGEVPSSWPAEALKAQATAGRTYAVEHIRRLGQHRPVCNCGLYGSTADQAYVGYEKEAGLFGDRWRKAVDDTDGAAVLYGGAPIEAFYSSSSGGHTENNENVWGGSPRPYLRGVSDPWDVASPHFTWTVTFGVEELQNRLRAFPETSVGVPYSVETLAPYGVSGRVLPVINDAEGGVRITGSAGTKRVSGNALRSVLNLKSTLFRVIRTGLHPDGTMIKGSGSAVYRIENQRLRGFPTMSTLTSWAKPEEIITVDDASLLQYKGAEFGFRDGTLIITPGGTVWIISGGLKRGFTSAEAFTGLGFSWSNLVPVSWEEAALHPEGVPISSTAYHPDGSLLKASGPAVWWMQGGAKRPMPTQAVFDSRFKSNEIVTVSDERINSYPDGPLLGYRDGSLIMTPGGTVWIVSGEQRRGFTSAEAFEALGYSWNNVRAITWEEAAAHPEGVPVSSSSQPHPDGTLLRGSLPYRYVLRGMRHLVRIDKVFDSWNFGHGEIVRIPDARLAGYDSGNPPLGFRDGSLILDPGGTVWLISGGHRRGFTSASAFNELGYSWSNIVSVSWGEIGLHPEGPVIGTGAAHPDGTLFKGSGNTVWWLLGGAKRPLPSMAVLESWFRPSEIVTTSDARIQSYPDGPVLGFRDGTLIAPDVTVWVISNGARRGFTSAEIFSALGYSWNNIRRVSWAEAGLHPEGEHIR